LRFRVETALLSPQTIAEEAEGEAKDEAAKGQELIQEPSSSDGVTEKNETPQIASDT
jgi:hypothetical protein